MEINELLFNPFTKIGEEWGLVSAGSEKLSNMMTVSWGGVGVLWGKNVTFLFIRESRYTKAFLDDGETFSLSFFDEKYKKALGFCGAHSGRDCDKWAEAHLTPAVKSGVVYPAEANCIFLCRKLAAVPMPESTFLDPGIAPHWYSDHDMHTMYIGEILDIIEP